MATEDFEERIRSPENENTCARGRFDTFCRNIHIGRGFKGWFGKKVCRRGKSIHIKLTSQKIQSSRKGQTMNPFSKKGSQNEAIAIDEVERATIGKWITEGNNMNQGSYHKEIAHALGDEFDEEEVLIRLNDVRVDKLEEYRENVEIEKKAQITPLWERIHEFNKIKCAYNFLYQQEHKRYKE
ncbi:hypothetical protein RhiirC2_788404 [Rhizophagus irregularis]|uniref:Uncharacterized protein n=1 Tax=Rhizophagus irregularis TaxID=588596 RepID=A0A2N1MQ67_9GLOM|nr:hypothetical protein RhiirC2_788404 [Rhizophagus irregularis]